MTRHAYHLAGCAHPGQPIPLASRVGPLLMSSNIGGQDRDGTLPSEPADEIASAFSNMLEVLRMAGGTADHVVKVDVAVSNLELRGEVNRSWLVCFPSDRSGPARHVRAAELPGGMRIQLAVTAFIEAS
jgi:2-iminobutanoate/2-iminopropanoate deaminase